MAKQILIKPITTEKATVLSDESTLNQYTFEVNKEANKLEIKKAVEERYNVRVKRVNTLITPARKKTRYVNGKMTVGFTSSVKKAIVTLPPEDYIDFYEGV